MSEYFLGMDGGQSSTTAVIGDERGQIAGWASAGPCNHVTAREAQAKFRTVVGECLSQAAARAGLDSAKPHFRAACFGMSGGPDDKAALLSELIDTEHLVVTHDAEIALAGATSGEPGIITIAGTGSMAFGKNARGETARAGGWGYIFGDEGGAFDVVRQALRAVLREHEGWGGRTALTPALLEATGAPDADAMLHLFYTPEWPRSRVAELARTVHRIAGEGDPAAREVLQRGAQQLALLAGSVRRQLWGEGDSVHVSWTGGLFNSGIVLERFRLLIELEDKAICEPPRHGPAIGALLVAWRAAGLGVTPDPGVTEPEWSRHLAKKV
jgi:N-acetylglucosamine kinase-like BadF-type ATPase